MNAATLVRRGLRHHWKAHAATLGGAAVAGAVLTGALAVGDSMRASLQRATDLRVGRVSAALGGGERFFRTLLARSIEGRCQGSALAPVLRANGVASTGDQTRRVLDVRVLGVDERFFALGPGASLAPLAPGSAALNLELARELEVGVGDEIVLRVERPSAVPRDLLLATEEDLVQPLRVKVAALASDEQFGRFALEAGAQPAANLFVSLEWLQERLGVAGRANWLLAHTGPGGIEELERALRQVWGLEDAGISLAPGDQPSGWRLLSERIFLEDPLVETLRTFDQPVVGVLTYFVNELRRGERTTPYSTVAALGYLTERQGELQALLGGPATPSPPRGEIWINPWLAEDLAASAGDEIQLTYFAISPARRLEEKTQAFRVGRILPIENRELTPDFPGLSDSESCRDWEPGIPIDLGRIRDKDEEYWDQHRGTPKAVLSLEDGQALWANRFGSLTSAWSAAAELGAFVAAHCAPARLGLFFTPVSSRVEATSDFGALFLGLSFFLIASACLLCALFFAFSIERRASEIGALLVLGFARRTVAGIFLVEALVLLALGAAAGVALGLGYTALLLRGLESLWRGAIGRTELLLHARPTSLALGAASAWLGTALAVGLVLARALRAPPLFLLLGRAELAAPRSSRPSTGSRIAIVALLSSALGAIVVARSEPGPRAAALTFVAGACVLVAGLLAVRSWLHRERHPRSLAGLGLANAARRPARSLTTAALVASAVFLLVVAGANRQGPTAAEGPRESGTGGFALVGRSSVPVLADLNEERGREAFGLTAADLEGVAVLPMRVHEGDEASCFNLDRPRSPRLLGVAPPRLSGRFAFAATEREVRDPWTLLDEDLGAEVVPAIVDATSLQWTLHQSLGDELELRDERGRVLRARIAATLADSILQGDLVIAERRFEGLFPSESGYRAFLVDAPAGRAPAVSALLARALADVGLSLSPAHVRLDLLHGVQNTYLAIFQVLAGLGLLLGSAGLFALVLRHALERRGELALARAVGFTRGHLRLAFLGENGALVLAGLAIGALAGMLALVPSPARASSLDELRTPAILLGAVAASGCLWIWLATLPALRGSPAQILREE